MIENNSGASSEREFVGARLELARTFRGLTLEELADKVSATFGLLSHYENGRRKEPAQDVVEALAEVLGVRPGFFFTPLDDQWREEECSFRHRRTTPKKLKTRARAHGTLVGLIVQHLAEELHFPAYNVPQFRASSPLELEQVAERCREHWNLGLDTPILHMGRVAEHAGVVLVQHFAESAKIDAFSRRSDHLAIIVLNASCDSTSRLIFDVAHECGHLVLHDGIVTGDKPTENEANYFAGAFLMPRKVFAREFAAKSFSWTHVLDLKKRWRVSAAAIIKRAYQLNLISALAYRQAFASINAQGWHSHEPYEPEFVGPELLPTALKTIEEGLGITVASVCEALNLTTETFSELTGIAVNVATRPKLVMFERA